MYLFFVQFLEYLSSFKDDNVDEETQYFSNSKSSAAGFYFLAFACFFFANFRLALLIKVLVMKKHVYLNDVVAKTSLIILNTSSAT